MRAMHLCTVCCLMPKDDIIWYLARSCRQDTTFNIRLCTHLFHTCNMCVAQDGSDREFLCVPCKKSILIHATHLHLLQSSWSTPQSVRILFLILLTKFQCAVHVKGTPFGRLAESSPATTIGVLCSGLCTSRRFHVDEGDEETCRMGCPDAKDDTRHCSECPRLFLKSAKSEGGRARWLAWSTFRGMSFLKC